MSPVEVGQLNKSITISVPDSVPSLTNNSLIGSGKPFSIVLLAKNNLESPATSSLMSESIFTHVEHIAGVKSMTIEVPPRVPSDLHSSFPCTLSSAVKYKTPFICTACEIMASLGEPPILPILATAPDSPEQLPTIISISLPVN